MNRADLKLYTPDRWYFNQYENGRLVMSNGFHTKALAESFAKSVLDEVNRWVEQGRKMVPGMTHEVEEAKGWSVDGMAFNDFHEALWYKWTERPNSPIRGIFK